MIIGNVKNLHAFNGKTGQALGLDYDYNKKAWMTRQFFFAKLDRFDSYMRNTPAQKRLLLVNNCSAHGEKDALPRLDNLRVEFLPLNSTSKVPPLDANIIALVKSKFHRWLLLSVFDKMDVGKSLCTI